MSASWIQQSLNAGGQTFYHDFALASPGSVSLMLLAAPTDAMDPEITGLTIANGIVCSNCRGYDEFVIDFAALDAGEDGDVPLSSGGGQDDDDRDHDRAAASGGGVGGRGGNGGGGDDDDDDGGGVTPPGYLDFEANGAAREFDRAINGPRRLRRENSSLAQRHLREISETYYDDLYGDPGLQRAARELVAGWSEDREENPFRGEVVAAWARVLGGHEPRTDLERDVEEIYGTRGDRWVRLSEIIGMEPPVGFRAFRGVRGDQFVEDVVRAWRDPSERSLQARMHEAASWALRREAAERFATGDGRYLDAGVVWDADVPFYQTLADKLVDDGRFVVPFKAQWEIIVGDSEPDSILMPVERVTVFYGGRKYGYDQRQDLIDAWDRRI